MIEKIGHLEDSNNNKLCDIIVFDDDTVILKWRGAIRSLVIHTSIEDVEKLHVKDERKIFLGDYNLHKISLLHYE